MTYSDHSNWFRYPKEDNNENQSQKFISPPYKGTIMAINLKGIRNPKRNNTIIKDLHFVAGVPMCKAFDATSGAYSDMSWWSGETGPIFNTTNKFWDVNAYLGNAGNYVVQRFGEGHSLARKWGFKNMARNDDTMHPYTFFGDGNSNLNKLLDYNAYEDPNDTQKFYNQLYKTHILQGGFTDS